MKYTIIVTNDVIKVVDNRAGISYASSREDNTFNSCYEYIRANRGKLTPEEIGDKLIGIIVNTPTQVITHSIDSVKDKEEAFRFIESLGIERINGNFYLGYEELSNDSPIIGIILSLLIDACEDFESKKNFLKKILSSHFDIHQINQICNFMLGRNGVGTNDYNLTDEGNFLLYRSVKIKSHEDDVDTYWDHHTGNVPQMVGFTYKMPESLVDKNPNNTCSDGLHVATLEYAKDFGRDKEIMLVEVDPRDILSVPTDYGFTKIRTSKYKVVGFLRDDVIYSDYHIDRNIYHSGLKYIKNGNMTVTVGQHGKIISLEV